MSSIRKKSFAAEHLARQKRKNPVVWVLVGVAVVALTVGGYVLYSQFISEELSPEPQKKMTIAVLPFVDMSPEKDQESFCDGLSDAIINGLEHIQGLPVIARTSSFAYKGTTTSIRDIGKELHADALLEGSVLKSGKRVVVTAQLIKTEDETHIFSERYDRDMDDLITIIEDITLDVVRKMRVTIFEHEREALAKRYTNDPVAYELFVLGLGTKNNENRIELFEQALERDPDFALAYIYIAHTYIFMDWRDDSEDINRKAKDAAVKALKIDETLAEAHAALGRCYMVIDWDFPSAEQEYIRALSLNPGSWMAHLPYGIYLAIIGNFEKAISEYQRVIDINPRYLLPYRLAIRCNTFTGQFEDAIKVLDTALQVNPEWKLRHWCLGLMELCKGNYGEAIDLLYKDYEIRNDPYMFVYIGCAYALSGQTEKAYEIISIIKELDFTVRRKSTAIAQIYICLGETDRAFEWIERAFKERENSLRYIKSFIGIEKISSDPRYKEILDKIGLPE